MNLSTDLTSPEADRRLLESLAQRLRITFGRASVLVSRLTEDELEALRRNEPILTEAVSLALVGVAATAH